MSGLKSYVDAPCKPCAQNKRGDCDENRVKLAPWLESVLGDVPAREGAGDKPPQRAWHPPPLAWLAPRRAELLLAEQSLVAALKPVGSSRLCLELGRLGLLGNKGDTKGAMGHKFEASMKRLEGVPLDLLRDAVKAYEASSLSPASIPAIAKIGRAALARRRRQLARLKIMIALTAEEIALGTCRSAATHARLLRLGKAVAKGVDTKDPRIASWIELGGPPPRWQNLKSARRGDQT